MFDAEKFNNFLRNKGCEAINFDKNNSKVDALVALEKLLNKKAITKEEYEQYLSMLHDFEDPWEKRTGRQISLPMLIMLWRSL